MIFPDYQTRLMCLEVSVVCVFSTKNNKDVRTYLDMDVEEPQKQRVSHVGSSPIISIQGEAVYLHHHQILYQVGPALSVHCENHSSK